jgi:hypothetical protein
MTIPTYSLFIGGNSREEYPPLAVRSLHDSAFQKSYEGNSETENRVRRAMIRYAVGRLTFWKLPIAEAVVLIVLLLLNPGHFSGLSLAALIVILIGIASLLPARVLWSASRAASDYAKIGKVYSATFSENELYWRTPDATYEVPLRSINRYRDFDQVVIVGLIRTKAICVLPHELIGKDERQKLRNISAMRSG